MNFKLKQSLHLIERVCQTYSMRTRNSSLIQKLIDSGLGTKAPGSQLAVWAESGRSLQLDLALIAGSLMDGGAQIMSLAPNNCQSRC